MSEVDIKGIPKPRLLMELYNNSKPQGFGFFVRESRSLMTLELAQEIFEKSGDKFFDYVNGRVLKVDLSSDVFSTRLYDRDIGVGEGERIVLKIIEEMISELDNEGLSENTILKDIIEG